MAISRVVHSRRLSIKSSILSGVGVYFRRWPRPTGAPGGEHGKQECHRQHPLEHRAQPAVLRRGDFSAADKHGHQQRDDAGTRHLPDQARHVGHRRDDAELGIGHRTQRLVIVRRRKHAETEAHDQQTCTDTDQGFELINAEHDGNAESDQRTTPGGEKSGRNAI